MMQAEIILYQDNQTRTISLSPAQIQIIFRLMGWHYENGKIVGYSDEVLKRLYRQEFYNAVNAAIKKAKNLDELDTLLVDLGHGEVHK